MTQHEKRMAGVLLREIDGLDAARAVERLFRLGMVDMRACERRLICERLDALEREGMPRCEAMHMAARELCCSYEKVRSAFYDKFKS